LDGRPDAEPRTIAAHERPDRRTPLLQVAAVLVLRTRLLLLALVVVAAPDVLAAQRPLRATGVRGIAFGVVIPGIPQAVARTDAMRSAEFEIAGPNRSGLLVSFTLPTVLTAPGGGSVPIVFGPASAGYSQSQAIGNQVAFDPAQPFAATLSNNGRGAIFLGATLQPAAGTAAGDYSAPITITLADVGT
jgi:hypothetical protein